MRLHTIPFLLVVAVLGGLAACGPASPPPPCAVLGASTAEREAAAVRCAEAFVVAQGYTDRPPTADSTTLEAELTDVDSTWGDILASRRGQLGAWAAGLCTDTDSLGTFVDVIFAPPQPAGARFGRGIRVETRTGAVHMIHQVFVLAALDSLPGRCRRLGSPVAPT